MRRYWRAETGVFLGLWLVLMVVGRGALLRDPGTFWHTVTGQWMLDNCRVIDADPFSFTRTGHAWVAYQWLAECGMATVYRLLGWDGLLLLTATILAGTYTWVAGRLLRARFHLLWIGGLLALVLLGSSHQFHVRPLILTIGLFGLTFALLLDIDSGRRKLRLLWLFVPLSTLWANLHGGVLAAIGTVGLCVGWWCIAWAIGRESPVRSFRTAVEMIVLVTAACLAVCVGPYGVGLPMAWLNTLSIPLPQLIEEHGRLDLHDPLGWTTILLGIGYIVALLGLFPKRPRPTWMLPLVWFVLACLRVRNIPLFDVAAAIALAEVLPQTRWAAWLEQREVLLPAAQMPSGRGGFRAAVLPVVLVAAVLSVQIAGISAPVVGRGWAKFDPSVCPVELLPELKTLDGETPGGTPIFNDLSLGGFLIYHTPGLRVFIDDRCALYGADFLQRYDAARRNDPTQLDRWQQQYDFRHALVETGTQFDRHLEESAAWTMVRRTPVATLYERHVDQGES